MALTRRTLLKTGAAVTAASMAPAIVRADNHQWRVAASLPMTGPFATAGQLVAPAFSEFEQQINDNGGIGGKPISVEVEDSGYVPRNALANFQRAMADGDLHFYYGDSTGFMELVGPTLRGENAVMMGSTSFASALSDPANRPYQFMAGPTYEDQFEILLRDIADKGGRTVAFVYSDTEFGRDPIEHGKRVAEELGIEVVLEEVTPAEGANIESHVTALAQADPEYTLLQGYVTGVWPQLIGGARSFGLQTQFMGTFWGMEKLIADRVTEQAGPFLDGYQGVMPYRYFYDQENAPFYRDLGAYKESINPDFAGYVSTWELEGRLCLELWVECMNRVIEADQPVTPDNLMAALGNIRSWDSGGFFGEPVDVVDNKIGQGRVYRYNADNRLFEPASDWITV